MTNWRSIPLILGATLCSLGAVVRILELDFVDLRYQVVTALPASPLKWIMAAGLVLLFHCVQFRILESCNSGAVRVCTGFLRANALLVLLIPFYFMVPSLPGVIFSIVIMSISAGRTATLMEFPKMPTLSEQGALFGIIIAVIFCAVVGAALQHYSFTRLAMQWLDWGHYYESLNNILKGRAFELNLTHGSFLGSRFCPGLVLLAPVVWFHSEPLFFLTGSLLVCSGALLLYFILRENGCTPRASMIGGFVFLLTPGVVNMNMPLLDGFHEVFLFFPVVFGAYLCYMKKKIVPAIILVLYSFTLRETVGFMYIGWGAALFFAGRRRDGAILAAGAAALTMLIIGIVMPGIRAAAGNYEHVVFYPHLGNSVAEIALSPVLRPRAFFGALFNGHNLIFWAMLLFPLLCLGVHAPLWLLPMAADFVMVSVDVRFDSQTVLRHYQIIMVLTLFLAAAEGGRRLREGRGLHWLERLYAWGLPQGNTVLGLRYTIVLGTVLSAFCFTQIPGTPGEDPRLPDWSDVRPLMAEFIKLIPPGAEVTAGPRIASHLVNTHEVFFDYDLKGRHPLRKYVFIESFTTMYHENEIRMALLKSPEWKLLKSGYHDERLLQLFEYDPEHPETKQSPVVQLSDEMWKLCGTPIPSGMSEIELRGDSGPGVLRIAVRVIKTLRRDVGIRLFVELDNGERVTSFVSFGDGIFPANFAKPGDCYIISLPLSATPRACRVDLLEI